MDGVEQQSAQISWVTQHDYSNIRLIDGRTVFDYVDENDDIQHDISLALIGLFQAENAALAITA